MNRFLKSCAAACAALLVTMSACSDGGDPNYRPVDNPDGSIAIQNIMTRTSVREYTGQAVSDDTLKIILQAAMAAPSAVDKRPWEFIVLKDQAKRDLIGQAIAGVGDKTKTAGAVVLVCGNTERFIERAPEYWVQDCSAATENLLLAVNAMGLGAVWCGVYPVEDNVRNVRSILALPENLIPLNVITIGYPKAVENPKDKWNPGQIITI